MTASFNTANLLDVTARLSAAGTSVSVATVVFTVPQVVTLSKGLLPTIQLSHIAGILPRAIVFQSIVKTGHFASLRYVRHGMDSISPSTPALNTMFAYGTTGLPFQSVLYNHIISSTYHYHKVSPPSTEVHGLEAVKQFVNKKIRPGIFWTFTRECCSTGGGLAMAPFIRPHVEKQVGTDRPKTARFLSGLTGGFICAFLTQWMHNAALRAGSMAEMGEKPTTFSSLARVINEFGIATIYRNYGKRIFVIGIASATLTVCDIFN